MGDNVLDGECRASYIWTVIKFGEAVLLPVVRRVQIDKAYSTGYMARQPSFAGMAITPSR